jgi:hypothetical protein
LSQNASAVVKVSAHNSQVVRNINYGLAAQSNSGASVALSVSSSMVSNNGNGIAASSAGSKVWASGNTISDNIGNGLANLGGLFESASNNAVRNNGLDTSGTITTIVTD